MGALLYLLQRRIVSYGREELRTMCVTVPESIGLKYHLMQRDDQDFPACHIPRVLRALYMFLVKRPRWPLLRSVVLSGSLVEHATRSSSAQTTLVSCDESPVPTDKCPPLDY